MQKPQLIASGTSARCTFGTQKAIVCAPYEKKMQVNNHKILTQADCISGVNIKGFGQCNANPECTASCQVDGVWLYTEDIPVLDMEQLLTTESCMVCARGGVVRFEVDKE